MATKKNTTVKSQDGKTYEYFRITRTVGHEWKNGKKVPIKKQFTGTSKGNAEKKYKEYLEEQHKQKEVITDNTKPIGTLMQYYADNILSVDQKYAHGTKIRYLSSYNVHIKDAQFTEIQASLIQASDIQKFYNNLDVTMSVIKGVHKFMVAFFKWASRAEKIRNVMPSVILPTKKENKRHEEIVVWTDDELEKITASLENNRLKFFVILEIYTGLRISELISVKYKDIDDNQLHVQRQYYKGEICNPKYDSKRYIPLHPRVIEELYKHKQWHGKEMEENGYKTDYIFTSRNGKLLDDKNIRRALKRMYANNNIPYKHFHAYRATFCTNLCFSGAPIEAAAKLMGHKSVEVTAKYYTFVSKSTMQSAIDNLPDFLA